jgi:plasmid stability protein
MPTLTIKNLPDDVYRRLKERAGREHRSLNREIILCLERAVHAEELDVDAWLAQAAKLRRRYKGPPLTDARIRGDKRRGRP